jgi:hypothetical protein
MEARHGADGGEMAVNTGERVRCRSCFEDSKNRILACERRVIRDALTPGGDGARCTGDASCLLRRYVAMEARHGADGGEMAVNTGERVRCRSCFEDARNRIGMREARDTRCPDTGWRWSTVHRRC